MIYPRFLSDAENINFTLTPYVSVLFFVFRHSGSVLAGISVQLSSLKFGQKARLDPSGSIFGQKARLDPSGSLKA